MDRLKDAMGRLRLLAADDAATMVEMAIAASVLFSLMFGVIFMGWALYAYDFVRDASAAGARYASVRGALCSGFGDCPDATNAQIQTYVRSIAYPGLSSSNITVNTEWYSVTQTGGSATTITDCDSSPTTIHSGTTVQCDNPGNEVQVKVQYAFPLTLWIGSSTLNMVGQSQLVISQ